MPINTHKLLELGKLKLLFGFGSLLATGVDYTLFWILVTMQIAPVTAHIYSASAGMVINFLVQNAYIFQRERSLLITFISSISISLIGILLSSALMNYLLSWTWFGMHPFLAKIGITAMLFLYNFYLKRFTFEKRFI